MNFLAGPLGSMAAGAADTLTDNYWNNVLPNDEKAAANFKATVLKKKAARANAIATGNAINSRLTSQARALATVEGFEEHSMADLIATIKMVEDSGLAKEGDAVAEILKNEDLKYTIKPASAKSKETDPDVKEQTSMALGTTSGTSTTPEAESRSAFQIMMHGKGSRGIQDSVLKEMGMTRKDFEALSNPVVRKRLNIGESAIKLALKKKVSPFVMSVVKTMGESVTQGDSSSLQVMVGKDPNGQPVMVDGETFEIRMMSALANAYETGDLSIVLPMLQQLNTAKAAKNFPGLVSEMDKIYENLNKAYVYMGDNALGQEESRIEVTELVNEIQKHITISIESPGLTLKEKKEKLAEVYELQSKINVLIQDKGPILPTVLENKEEETAVRSFLAELAQKQETVIINGEEVSARDVLTKFNKHMRFMTEGQPDALTARSLAELRDIVGLAKDVVPPISIEDVSRQIFDSDGRLRKEIAGLEFPPEESRKPTDTDVSFLRGSQIIATDANKTNKELLAKYETLWTEFSKDPNNKELEKKVRDVQNELAIRNPKKGEKPSAIVNDVMKDFVNRLNAKSDNASTPEYLRSSIFNLQETAQELSAQFREGNISVEQLTTGRDSLRSTYNSIISSSNSFVAKADPILNMVDKVMTKVSIEESNKFNKDDIIKLIQMQRNMKEIVNAAQNMPEKQQEEALLELVKLQTAFITASKLSNTDAPTPSALDEKVEAILKLEKDRMPNMTELQEETARVLIKGLLAQGNLVTTKDGTFMRSFNADTGNVELVQVASLTGEGNLITINKENFMKNKEKVDNSLAGESTTGGILETFMENPNAFNFIGDAQLFGLDLSDLFNSMGAKSEPFFGNTREELDAVQRARTDATTLLQSARQQLFGSDSRLSDMDLRVLNKYLKILENNMTIIGTSRGQAALGIIQAAMTKDIILREKDVDFDNKLTIAESFEAQTKEDIANMSRKEESLYIVEKQLGFKVGPDSGESLAKTSFYRLLRSYGITKLVTPEEAKAMDKRQQVLYAHKVQFAIQQMQFVMSDIYVYAANGVKNKNNIVNQMLQDYQDLE